MPIRLPSGDPCYFCQIVAGGSDGWGVIEKRDLTLTMLNGRQFETGQCIVVSCRHAPTILDLTDEESQAVLAAARQVSGWIVDAFDPDGILLYQSNGLGSGQEVPHFHLHVVPRRANSDWGAGPPHLADVERGGARFDHTCVTDDKIRTVEILRRHALGV